MISFLEYAHIEEMRQHFRGSSAHSEDQLSKLTSYKKATNFTKKAN
ncbi:hypothetical protein KIS4809_4898 [Bacillus sp. ZZV12-4809]|nr:hypothetical protein KIS4809_4898 [Bacillus sp. ZZV12-4809]